MTVSERPGKDTITMSLIQMETKKNYIQAQMKLWSKANPAASRKRKTEQRRRFSKKNGTLKSQRMTILERLMTRKVGITRLAKKERKLNWLRSLQKMVDARTLLLEKP